MQLSVKQRIKYLIKKLSITQSEFERRIGASNGYINSISRSIGGKYLAAISREFPNVNTDWILFGEGDMIKSQDREFEIPVGEYREDEIPDKFMTCLVPMSAMGGSLIGFEESGVRREDCEKVVSPIADADWAVPVCGDSMEPEYPNGSRVYVKRIDPYDFIAWGNVFVLDTTNGLIIKMVMQSDKKDCIKCVSLNTSGRYQPFDVPMRTVRAMYRVLLCVSVK